MSEHDDDLAELDELAETLRSGGGKARGEEVARTSSRRNRPRTAGDPTYEGEDNSVKDNKMWAVYGGRNYNACEEAVKTLPPGQYTVDVNDSIGIFFHREDINLDELITLPDSQSQRIIDEIQRFWTLESRFRDFGFLWKRGVLLWGPPGSGKTSTLQVISKNIVDQGGLSIYVTNPDLSARALKTLRQVEPRRPVVIMLEDIDAIIDDYGEADLLALMDGELQIDNVVFVATTNYPKQLDRRFINRPSRFDIVKKIGMPSEKAREVYLKSKNHRLAHPENKAEMGKWLRATEDLSIAHLKELIISVEVLGQSLDTSVARLRKMNDMKLDENKSGFGFTGKDDPDEDL